MSHSGSQEAGQLLAPNGGTNLVECPGNARPGITYPVHLNWLTVILVDVRQRDHWSPRSVDVAWCWLRVL
jgi:hypothetical protein